MENQEKYDSTEDTMNHIGRVNALLNESARILLFRGSIHDSSKLLSPEKEIFDEFTPKLKDSTYGSDEYKQFLKDMQVALDHHYQNNSHHPEHYPEGVDGMNLFDVLEMFMDWKAATERHANGDIYKSIDMNEKRFKMSPQLAQIFRNTAKMMGWEK